MKLNWSLIKEKYPKAINRLMGYIHNRNQDYKNKVIMSFIELCYCDLEKFFDNNNIEIFIKKLYKTNHKKTWLKEGNYRYWILIKSEIITSQACYASRNESKEQSVYKAFEILEKELTND